MPLKAVVTQAWMHPYPGGFMLVLSFYDLLTPSLVIRRASINFDEGATMADVATKVAMVGETIKRDLTPRALDSIVVGVTVFDAENSQANI